MTTSVRKWVVAATLGALAGGAMAQQAGDWVVGGGALFYLPQDKSQPLRITEPVQAVIPGSGANVKNAATLGLNVHYFLTDHWAIEGVMGIPPRIKLDGAGTFGPLGRLGHARLYAPAILGKYFFGQPEDKWRVSLGAGVAYNSFRSVGLSGALQNAMGASLGLPPGASNTSAHIGSKWAPILSAGVNYAFNKHWGLSFSVSYLPMKVRADLDTQVGGHTVARSSTRIRLDPVVPFLYLTYRF